MMQSLRSGERQDMPGLIRASFGIYNTVAEIDAFVDLLDRICSGDYLRDPATGTVRPETDDEWETSQTSWSSRKCA